MRRQLETLMGAGSNFVVRQMLEVMYEDCPWSFTDHRIQYTYLQPWLHNFKYLQFSMWAFKYYRVDQDVKREKLREMGRSAE